MDSDSGEMSSTSETSGIDRFFSEIRTDSDTETEEPDILTPDVQIEEGPERNYLNCSSCFTTCCFPAMVICQIFIVAWSLHYFVRDASSVLVNVHYEEDNYGDPPHFYDFIVLGVGPTSVAMTQRLSEHFNVLHYGKTWTNTPIIELDANVARIKKMLINYDHVLNLYTKKFKKGESDPDNFALLAFTKEVVSGRGNGSVLERHGVRLRTYNYRQFSEPLKQKNTISFVCRKHNQLFKMILQGNGLLPHLMENK